MFFTVFFRQNETDENWKREINAEKQAAEEEIRVREELKMFQNARKYLENRRKCFELEQGGRNLCHQDIFTLNWGNDAVKERKK